MKKISIAFIVMVLAGAGICRAEDVKLDGLTSNQEVRELVSTGEKNIQTGERFKSKVSARKIKAPQIQSRAKEMKISTDVSTPKFTSRQQEMKITDHGAARIQTPRFKSAEVVKIGASGAGERALTRTGQLNNMQVNYMGKIMEGRVDYMVNQGDRN